MQKTIFFLFLFFPIKITLLSENVVFTNSNSHNFNIGEKISYNIKYEWGFMWVNAGEVTFTVDTAVYAGKNTFLFKGLGTTYKQYDWFYKVSDLYQSNVEMETLKPIRFYRNVNEGSTHYVNDYKIKNNKIYAYELNSKGKVSYDTLDMNSETFDILGLMYEMRGLDFSKFKIGQTIQYKIFLDKALYSIKIEYKGIEKVKTLLFGEKECYKISPKLVAGTIFKEDSKMEVWITNDKNQIPILIETGILVGSVKVDLKTYKNLKHPFLK